MKRLVLISLDALSDKDLEELFAQPFCAGLRGRAAVVRGVRTVFVSNTYPIHTSVVTGAVPAKHGIISNLKFKPCDESPDWHWYARDVKLPTLYGEAKKRGLDALSIMWPVTGRSGIRYNIPEIFANRPWKNQLLVSLLAGSPLFSVSAKLRFGKLLRGIAQPERDDFCTAVFCDCIERKKPALMLLHLTDADTQKHEHGCGSDEERAAVRRMDKRLESVFTALKNAGIEDETSVIVFSDHAQRDIFSCCEVNEELKKAGVSSDEAYFEPCGGSAFAFAGKKADRKTEEKLKSFIEKNSKAFGIERFLSDGELKESGYAETALFGVAARPGAELEARRGHAANHGYPTAPEDYRCFYFAVGPDIKPLDAWGGSITDICPTAARLLGFDMVCPDARPDKRIIEE